MVLLWNNAVQMKAVHTEVLLIYYHIVKGKLIVRLRLPGDTAVATGDAQRLPQQRQLSFILCLAAL